MTIGYCHSRAIVEARCRDRTFLLDSAAPINAVRGPVGIGATLDGNVPNGDNVTPRAAAALLILWSFTDPVGGGPGRVHICTVVDDNELPRGVGRELAVPRDDAEGCK